MLISLVRRRQVGLVPFLRLLGLGSRSAGHPIHPRDFGSRGILYQF